MSYISIIDRIKVVFDLIVSSQILVSTIILILMAIFFSINDKFNVKRMFKMILIINAIAFIALIIVYNNEIIKTFDEIINKVFLNFYFPSVEIYLFILLFMIVTLIISIFKINMRKSQKVINTVSFFLMFYLFIALLYVISTKNIDIFNPQSIYTNSQAISLLELSTLIFIVWIIITLINSISNYIYCYIMNKKTRVVNEELADSMDSLRENAYNIDNSYVPYMANDVININSEDLYKDSNNDITVSDVKPQFVNVENNVKGKYSLEQYKIFNNILKQVIILNSYKPKITMDDLLDENILLSFSKEEQSLYKEMLLNTIN